MKRLISIGILFVLMSLTGCIKQANNIDFTEASRKVSFNDVDGIVSDLENIIKGESGAIDETINFTLDQSDVLKDFEVINKYYFNNAIYIQVSSNLYNYMYRFQFKENQLISYIKYELEE